MFETIHAGFKFYRLIFLSESMLFIRPFSVNFPMKSCPKREIPPDSKLNVIEAFHSGKLKIRATS